jgi:hypothetical protein
MKIKPIGVAGRLERRVETGVTVTAAVIVHRLICPPATDARSCRSGSVVAPARQYDFGGVKKRIDGNRLHRGRLQRS